MGRPMSRAERAALTAGAIAAGLTLVVVGAALALVML